MEKAMEEAVPAGMRGDLKRTHGCGELREEHVGQAVRLAGWVQRTRALGGLTFFDLRDRSGLVQVVCDPARNTAAHAAAGELRGEFVVAVRGRVVRRAPETVNPRLPTGTVEVEPDEIVLLNRAKTPPFEIEESVDTDELVRLKYRYLDLRRPDMQRNLILRHRVVQAVRDALDRAGFLEIETPMLTRSTPEGARDFLVPSRLNPGTFYALPQSPQLFKQLLMVAGMERYFQIVRCFRDEDLRADRQPEFTQIDLEMSFVDEADVMAVTEGLVAAAFAAAGLPVPATPLPRLTWREAMDRYGTDKPDLRCGLELRDVTDTVRGCGFKVFADAAAQDGGCVKGLVVPGANRFSRKDLDDLTEEARGHGAKGLAWMIVEEPGRADGGTAVPAGPGASVRSPIAKFFTAGEREAVLAALGAEPGDLCLFAADRWRTAVEVLGQIRLSLARRLGLIRERAAGAPAAPEDFRFVWVTDFPLLEWDGEEKRWVAVHHPFTSPAAADLERLETDPAGVRARAYDLVLNGVELGGGSIRIHRRDVQERMFRALGIAETEARAKFGFLLDAFEYGTPPHGGIALGLDRMIALMAGVASIRDVIAFPKTARAVDPMTAAPAPVEERQLRDLHVVVVRGKE